MIMKTGVELICEERLRQVSEEGYSYEHDDEHAEGEITSAAYCYLWELSARSHRGKPCETPPPKWPWDSLYWKPTDEIRQLVKAGALIAAEIDRLQRVKK